MAISVFTHPKCQKHNMDPEHPECPERLSQIQDQLISSGLASVVNVYQGRKVERDHLYLAHSKAYIDGLFNKDAQLQVRTANEAQPYLWLDDDTIMMQASLEAALYAAGCATEAVDEVFRREDTRAFCAIRPPGHHACHAQAMGFCLVNNVAVAATYAQQRYGVERVAIIDFDVHHGNGTEDIFQDTPSVMLCSSFQHPFYPFGGLENQPAHFYPVPLHAGDGGEVFRSAVAHWFDAIDAFCPELILISAGFDAHQEDDMGHIRLVEDDYIWITTELKALADKHCHGRIVSVLEGGYALSALGRSAVAHIKALL